MTGSPRDDGKIRIVVKADIAEFTQPGSALDWRSAAGRAEKANRLGRAAWTDAGRPRSDRQVRISVVVRRAAPVDELNIPVGCKHFLDGFCRSKVKVKGWSEYGTRRSLIPDDSWKWARWGSFDQEIRPEFKGREEIEFIIEPVEPDGMLWSFNTKGTIDGKAEAPQKRGRL